MRTLAARYASAVLVLAVMFTAGLFVGRRIQPRPSGPDLEITRNTLLDALEPSSEQRLRLQVIMESARIRADSIMAVLLGEIRDLSHETELEMRTILSREQNEALDTLLSHPVGGARSRQRIRQ